MKAIVSGDLVIGLRDGDGGGPLISADLASLPVARLRVHSGAVIDAAATTTWFVDSLGRKHLAQDDPSWHQVTCAWDAPLVLDGTWSAVSELDQVKAVRADQVNQKREALLAGGFAHDFGGSVGVKTLQTRSDDRVNWLTSQAGYSAAVAGGHGTDMGAVFRASDNTVATVSYAAGLSILLSMGAWGAAVYGKSWALKDAIKTAADVLAVDGIDIDSGWPAGSG